MSRLVHELTRFDRPRLHEHFRRLSAEDRYLRFGLPRDDASLAEYVDGIDFGRDFVLGIGGPGFSLAAVAHVGLISRIAEVGLSVLPGFRRQNLASLALQRAARHASVRGAVQLWIHFLRENRAILAVARKCGMRIELQGAEGDAYLALSPVAQLTYAIDCYETQFATLARAWRVPFLGADRYFAHQPCVWTTVTPAPLFCTLSTNRIVGPTRGTRPRCQLPHCPP